MSIHERGINYVQNLLDRSGFTIHIVNKDLSSHSQLSAKAGDRSLLIAVHTACHPDAGRLVKENREKLIKESETLDAVPYFAGILLTSMNDGHIQAEDIAKESEHKVIFNGMAVIR
ncbi:MAG: hypothetical protein ACR2PB_12850 [Desulfocapsaceae bacterium]